MTQVTIKKRSPRFRVVLIAPVAIVAAVIVVLLAQWLRTLAPVQGFLQQYPGHTKVVEGTPTGFPAWLNAQHFLSSLFILLIIRSGWQVRTTKRPTAFYTRNNNSPFKTKNLPGRISLQLWSHLSFDILWVLNGVVFVILLFVTGQWLRIVPTSWEVIPNAVSAALQYASFNWPTEDGWTNYNSLQVLAYFATVFIAAPLAIITGLRMSGLWPRDAKRLNRVYPIGLARAVHFPVMLYFVLFIIVHVVLVFATGALRNLNHMYASHDAVNWVGFAFFAGSVIVMAAAWIAARPVLLRPLAALTGKVGR